MNFVKLVFYPLGIVFLLTNVLKGQDYSRVRIDLSERSLFSLQWLGLEIDHGKHIPGRYYESDFSKEDIQKMQKAGILHEVIIKDVQGFYAKALEYAHNISISERGSERYLNCFKSQFDMVEPANFRLGSMSGYYTYDEIQDELDLMAVKYPHLISGRQPIGNFRTEENRPIYWLRISNHPNEKKPEEKQILYTALHHAREPMSVVSLIYYMWHLLENYETDPEIKALVDNTELYFVPVVNPDGVVYNEIQSPNGGGLWRKNRKVNGDGTFGVDLNRNYGANWAFDNVGSSGNTNSQVFRGHSSFSEAETQAVKYLCEEHNFIFAMNYHSFGNLLIFPYGYQDSMTPDSVQFRGFSKVMTRDNGYKTGNSFETVEYATNGDSDDWMYEISESKGKIYSFTPEVGDLGFYPTNIRELASQTLYQNLSTLRLVHNYAELEILSDHSFYEENYFLKYRIDQFGLGEEPVILRVSAYNNNLLDIDPAKGYNLLPGESVIDSIRLSLIGEPEWAQDVKIIVEMDYGLYSIFDTIKLVYGSPAIVTFTTGEDVNEKWENIVGTSRAWGVTDEDYFSAPLSVTESPYAHYTTNAVYEITTAELIDLTESVKAVLSYQTKWDIEENYDYAQVLVARENEQFEPVCGKYTKKGSVFQDEGRPVYEGRQGEWVKENIDLEEYLGEKIAVRFQLVSDGLNNMDGFYFDDFAVSSINRSVTSQAQVIPVPIEVKIYPNPARVSLTLDFSEIDNFRGIKHVSLYNNLGQRVYSIPWEGDYKIVLDKSSTGITSGFYSVMMEGNGIARPVGKIIFLD